MSTAAVTPNIQGLPPGATLKPIQGLPPGAELRSMNSPPPAEQPQGNAGFFGPLQDLYDSAVSRPSQEDQQKVGPVGRGLANFGRGAMELAEPIMHPIDTAKALPRAMIGPGGTGILGTLVQSASKDISENGPAEAIPHQLGNFAGGIIAGEAPGMVSDAASAARTAAIGDTDAAALRGLQVGPRSPKTLRTLSAIEGARPFVKGASSLDDLQGRIPAAKAEIWQPYNDAIDAVGDKPVKGPDGMTTVRELESERAQLSALNRGLKSNLPEAVQLAQQKGMTAAELLQREKSVQSALDPELAKTGIDPKAIRKAFGQVSEVGGRVSGKSTLIENPQPSGLGKIGQLSLEKPLQAPGKVLGGIRDLIAGRPWLEAKPTDLGIKEGFASGGEKPNFGRVTTTGYRPIDAGTTPSRLGRLLPDSVPARDLPLSSYNEIFPDQIPQGRLLDLIRESRKK